MGSLGLSGCAAPIIGGLTAAQVFSIAGLGATIMTGRDLTEHAVSMVTGKDCRFLETLFRNGRSFCETPDSVATRDDFHGVIALLDNDKPNATPDGIGGTKVAAASLDPDLLGFAPIDRHAAEDFSLEIARKNRGGDTSHLSFGMLSAAFGQSWDYNLAIRDQKPDARIADATPVSSSSIGLRPARAEYFGL
ncbi:hypothetical protein [Parvibaculum sp.]|uniref:hypothetical protein n=1 Tax=Parvibaculum sp. TaxID=2024848 RepID=UPI002CAEBB9B|nr:hypothetical protein [Parvibaculum sp.]HUD50897.1 hypothetical protein [Parvibaculum sp.]